MTCEEVKVGVTRFLEGVIICIYILHNMYLLDLFVIYSYHMRRRFMCTPSATCTLLPGTHNTDTSSTRIRYTCAT